MAQEMKVVTLSADFERLIRDSISTDRPGSVGSLEPGLAERLLGQIQSFSQQLEATGQIPVLLVSDQIRLWLARFVKSSAPRLKVLAFSEVSNNKQIKVTSTVGQMQTQAA
jgi:flagellar biosynthesis protein FlhA